MKRGFPPEKIERQHIDGIFENSSSDFDKIKSKNWPHVQRFVESLDPGSTLLDIGCGYGRNLGINPEVIDVGTDFSKPLCSIVGEKAKSVFCSSALSLPVVSNFFDHVICIGVIHHFASEEKRLTCLQEVARVLRPGGTALVTAWAKNQEDSKTTVTEADKPADYHTEREDPDAYYHFFSEDEFTYLIDRVPDFEFVEQILESNNYAVIVRKTE